MQHGYAVPEVVTGKPIPLGGSVFRREATGAGVVMVIERACARLGWNLAEQRCVVQGFGNVGGVAAQELADRGAVVIAVADISGGIYSPSGIDVASAHAWVAEHGSLAELPERRARHERGAARAAERHPRARGARGPADRRERAPHRHEARRGGRERPDRQRGGRDPRRAGILVLPDVLTNAGGVTVSYFEWVQDLGRLFWTATRSARGSPRSSATRSTASGTSPRARPDAPQRRARRRDPRGRGGTRGARDLPVSRRVRDAMVADPPALDGDPRARRRRARLFRGRKCATCSSARAAA